MCAVALVTSGCANRQNDPTAGVSRAAAPLNYETTVTNYFELTSRVPPAQRKLSFSAPETTNCRILASSGGHLGWVVPVMYEASAPPPTVPPALSSAAPAKSEAPAQSAKAAPPVAKGKAANAKQKKGAAPPVAAASAPGASTGATAVGAAVAMAAPVAGSDTSMATLDNVSVTGKTRYFFWFDRETINAVTKRMDICP